MLVSAIPTAVMGMMESDPYAGVNALRVSLIVVLSASMDKNSALTRSRRS